MPTKKGTKSKSMPGKLDYTTKKGSKFYTRAGHELRPYKQKKGGFAFLPFLIPLAAGLASGGISYGTQKVLKKAFGAGHRKKKH